MHITIPLDDISKQIIDLLENVFINHKGNYPVKFLVLDETEQIALNFFTSTMKINLSSECLDDLSLIPLIDYKFI